MQGNGNEYFSGPTADHYHRSFAGGEAAVCHAVSLWPDATSSSWIYA
jgi:hypothetical protein